MLTSKELVFIKDYVLAIVANTIQQWMEDSCLDLNGLDVLYLLYYCNIQITKEICHPILVHFTDVT